MRYHLAALAALSLVSGCSTIVNGTDQTVSVRADASEITDARIYCDIKQKKREYVIEAPGAIEVDKSHSDLSIFCYSTDKAAGGAVVVSSNEDIGEGVLYSGVGNAFFGGLIGVTVDAITAANAYYPSLIEVPMSAVTEAREGPAVTAIPESEPIPQDLPSELLDFAANMQCMDSFEQLAAASNARGTRWKVTCDDGEELYALCLGGQCYVQ